MWTFLMIMALASNGDLVTVTSSEKFISEQKCEAARVQAFEAATNPEKGFTLHFTVCQRLLRDA